MAKSRFRKAYRNLVSTVSFSSELRKMRRELNAKIDQPDSINPPTVFHPQGVNRWFKRRRISIAESYLRVVRDLDSRHAVARLEALRTLANAAFHSTNLDYPLNTARVQIALIKQCVKHRNDKRRQLELLYDFSMSTRGQHQVIRKLCDELNIVELPEKGMTLADHSYGWDTHVHDTATSGRKNPTQLVIDAFIKGISRITVAYGSRSDIEMMSEAVEAGSLLGVEVRLALEFSVMEGEKRYHFHALLPELRNAEEIRSFFAGHEQDLGWFFEGLDINRSNRLDAARQLLEDFNREHLPAINEGFPESPLYRLEPLTMEEFLASMPSTSITRLHLAEFLYAKYRPILRNRVWLFKVLREKARHEAETAADGQQQAADRKARKKNRKLYEEFYSNLRDELRDLSPDVLLTRYFEGPRTIEYRSRFEEIDSISRALRNAGMRIRILHPMEHGIKEACDLLSLHADALDELELYNTQDAYARPASELQAFGEFINRLNGERLAQGKPVLVPVCGSDATGRNPKVPGMGFIFEDAITGRLRTRYIERHLSLHPLVAALVRSKGMPVNAEDVARTPRLICMGKEGARPYEGESDMIPLPRVWRYSNPVFKNLVRTGIGFLVATEFIGVWYAMLWLGITAFRNSIADLVSSRGTRLSQWKLRSINFDNVAQSLFWTGFSVPILGFVKTGFDAVWPWQHEGMLFNFVKFFFISFSNGLYLASHNTLRGFDRSVVRANFFRSVIAWPLATAFAPLGDLLRIPSIVQTKIWSDVVAGFIEGGNKYLKVVRLRHKNLEDILPCIIHEEGEARFVAILDLTYLFMEEPRTQSTLKAIFSPYTLVTRKLRANSSLRMQLLVAVRDALQREHLYRELVDYILARYDEETADDLIDLVTDGLPELQEWLDRLVSRYSKEEETIRSAAAS